MENKQVKNHKSIYISLKRVKDTIEYYTFTFVSVRVLTYGTRNRRTLLFGENMLAAPFDAFLGACDAWNAT